MHNIYIHNKWLAEIMQIGCKTPDNQLINKSSTHLIFFRSKET